MKTMKSCLTSNFCELGGKEVRGYSLVRLVVNVHRSRRVDSPGFAQAILPSPLRGGMQQARLADHPLSDRPTKKARAGTEGQFHEFNLITDFVTEYRFAISRLHWRRALVDCTDWPRRAAP